MNNNIRYIAEAVKKVQECDATMLIVNSTAGNKKFPPPLVEKPCCNTLKNICLYT
jgi:hypothetical protein